MTIKEILNKYNKIEIELLLMHVLQKNKEFLFMNPEYGLTSIQIHKLISMIRRREKGEPMAYILGYKDFCGLRFKVNKNVLVPRPETEELVNTVIASASEAISKNKGLPRSDAFARNDIKILDVGTGSGCIAISLAKGIFAMDGKDSLCQIVATDISKKALEVAKKNAKTHYVKIKFTQSDLLEKIKFVPDIIVANLPYGWLEWKNNTSTATVGLKFEPKEALFTKEKGLFEIHRLLKQIVNLPSLPKYIYLEFDPRQKTQLHQLIKKYLPKADINFYKDLAKKWRFVEIKNT